MKIYVGNLSYSTTEQSLRESFEPFGNVDTVTIMTDRDTGKSRGFGFVEMLTKSEGIAAISGLNDTSIDERNVVVNEARPRNDNRSGGYGNRDGRGGNRSGGVSGGRQRRYQE